MESERSIERKRETDRYRQRHIKTGRRRERGRERVRDRNTQRERQREQKRSEGRKYPWKREKILENKRIKKRSTELDEVKDASKLVRKEEGRTGEEKRR